MSVMPLVEEIRPAPEPLDAFRRLASLPYVIFLDSAAPDGERGRYSYLAAQPFELIIGRGERSSILRPASGELGERSYRLVEERRGAPFALVAERLEPWAAPEIEGFPPFQGGAAGLFGYGLSRTLESLPPPRYDEFEAPDLALGLYDRVLAFDHVAGRSYLFSSGFPAPAGEARKRAAAAGALELRKLLDGRRPAPPAPPAASPRPLSRAELAPHWPLPGQERLFSNFERSGYMAAVARAIEYIHAGDIFQVNLSQRLLAPQSSAPLEFYLRLRAANPAPFAGYFDMGEMVIASSSPEQFLSLAGDEVVTRPIKGTRSRGYSAEEDSFRRDELRESAKDRAENVMIVDLLRNDLSRVCRPQTVTVPRLFELERHPTVHHLVSEVRGRLRPGCGALDLLAASFPGGSVTGAPKVRAEEIIAELEPTARGAYCGSLAWIAFGGGMGSSILIRTVTIGRGWLQFPAGGGIVADSRPAIEYQETLDKAAGMARALG
jgi:para-aminobenzoate synthetase component 1